MHMKHIFQYARFFKTRAGIVAGIVIILIAGYLIFKGDAPVNNLVTVVRGSVSQEVSATGKTKPVHDVNLAFEKGGKIARVYRDVGDSVEAGGLIVALDASELSAQLAEAQAKLDKLVRGARPEDVKIAQTTLAKAEKDLENYYANAADIVNDAYAKADDAVRKQLDTLFSNDEETNVQLSFSTTDSQKKINVEAQRGKMTSDLNAWKSELANLQNDDISLDAALSSAVARLNSVRSFLTVVTDNTLSATGVSASTLNDYRALITTARTNINTALTNVNAQIQEIASQKLTKEKAADELALKVAGSDPQEIAGQEAAVALVNAQLAKTVIRAPFAGIVTMQDAEVGEIVAANIPVVSVISKAKLEIEANVPEADTAKVNIGNSAVITFDAFGESLKCEGKVVAIDPAATVVEGVPAYKTTFMLDRENPAIKPGLTANVTIKTQTRENVLVIPQRSIVYRGSKKVVLVIKEGVPEPEEREVTTGIRGTEGLIEILSGVSEGEQILASPQ